MNRFGSFEPRMPRKTDDGIHARSQRGNFAEHWWAERWIKSLEQITDAGRLRRGRSYARGGQVVSIEESKGQIQARVQGSRPQPYKISIQLQPLSDEQWRAVLMALSERAIFTAQLLAGEMPQEIEEAFTAAGVALLPASSEELVTNCSCPDWASPCKHVAAVHYILAEQFDEDPFLIFRLRGRSQEEIMATLRQRRESQPESITGDAIEGTTESATVVAEQAATYTVAEETLPLDTTLTTFWQMGASLEHFPIAIQPPAQPYPLLRRLGAPSFAQNLAAGIGPVYDALMREAVAVAFAGEIEA